MPANDNKPIASEKPINAINQHGGAALLLTESLFHVLVERSSLTNRDIHEIVKIAN